MGLAVAVFLEASAVLAGLAVLDPEVVALAPEVVAAALPAQVEEVVLVEVVLVEVVLVEVVLVEVVLVVEEEPYWG